MRKSHRERTELRTTESPFAHLIMFDGDEIGKLTTITTTGERLVFDNFNRTHEMLDFPDGDEGRMEIAVQFAIFMDMEMR